MGKRRYITNIEKYRLREYVTSARANPRIKRRAQAVLAYGSGEDISEIVQCLGVSRASISKWAALVSAKGADSLLKSGGRFRRASEESDPEHVFVKLPDGQSVQVDVKYLREAILETQKKDEMDIRQALSALLSVEGTPTVLH